MASFCVQCFRVQSLRGQFHANLSLFVQASLQNKVVPAGPANRPPEPATNGMMTPVDDPFKL